MNNSYQGYDILASYLGSYGGSNLSTDPLLGSDLGMSYSTPSAPGIVGWVVAIGVPFLLWIALCILCYLFFMRKKVDKTKGLAKFFDFQRIYAGKLFKILYMVTAIEIPMVALAVVLYAIFFAIQIFFQVLIGALLMVVVGEIVLRVSYELLIMFIRASDDIHAMRWGQLNDVAAPDDRTGEFESIKTMLRESKSQMKEGISAIQPTPPEQAWMPPQGAPVGAGPAAASQGAPVGATAAPQGVPTNAGAASAPQASSAGVPPQGAVPSVAPQGSPYQVSAQPGGGMPTTMPAPEPQQFAHMQPQQVPYQAHQPGFGPQTGQQPAQPKPGFAPPPQSGAGQGNPFGSTSIWA